MPKPDDSAPTVLLVDDSSAVRAALAKGLGAQGLKILGGAADPYMARDLILKLKPDVITLDLQLPHMDGLTFLARLMAYQPLPVVVLSSLTSAHRDLALRAMELGAVEVFPKPSGLGGTEDMARLARTLRRAAATRPRAGAVPMLAASGPQDLDLNRIVAIGASTGGTSAIQSLLSILPASFPPLLLVQHMPAGFTDAFARRLDRHSQLHVKEAEDGDLLQPGVALLAPGGLHMQVQSLSGRLRVRCAEGPPVNHVCPSVDVLFHSLAAQAGPRTLAALLTGMGRDGAEGLLALRQAGAQTLAQDEASSVVWGMPGEAHRLGAADSLVPLASLGHRLIHLLSRSPVHSA